MKSGAEKYHNCNEKFTRGLRAEFELTEELAYLQIDITQTKELREKEQRRTELQRRAGHREGKQHPWSGNPKRRGEKGAEKLL